MDLKKVFSKRKYESYYLEIAKIYCSQIQFLQGDTFKRMNRNQGLHFSDTGDTFILPKNIFVVMKVNYQLNDHTINNSVTCCRYILQSRHGHCKGTHFLYFLLKILKYCENLISLGTRSHMFLVQEMKQILCHV